MKLPVGQFFRTIAVSIMAMAVIFWFLLHGKSRQEAPLVEDLSRYQILDKQVDGDSMSPLLHSGDRVRVVVGYYKDHVPQDGDIVAYNYGGRGVAIIKMVKATDSDSVTISGSHLVVNGEILSNSAGTYYQFGPDEIRMLSLYVQWGRIPKGSYLIFGDNISNSIDSRKFGAVAATDFFGKFIRQ